MTERPVIAPRLRQFDARVAERGMPVAAKARVAERLRREAIAREATAGFRFRWLPALTFAAGAALVLLVVGLGLRSRTATQEGASASAVLGMFAVQGEGCRHREDAGQALLDGSCRLVAPHMTVQTWERVVLQRGQEQALRLVEGMALFDVTTVEPGQDRVRIEVSHGVIEVLGTRFAIEQGARGGHVDLFEGGIRFVGLQGERAEISPGERHAWGDAVVAEVAVVPEPPVGRAGATGRNSTQDHEQDEADAESASGRGSEPRVDAEGSARRRRARRAESPTAVAEEPPPEGSTDEATAVIEQVSRMRSQGRYVDAAAVLRRALDGRRWDRRTAQVLSYELGEIVERHLGDPDRACVHWAAHAARFPGGRYDAAVKAARQRLGCAPEPEPALGETPTP
ncbi:MAG: FecR domain-containing protein [Nannocystaceae bacterium]